MRTFLTLSFLIAFSASAYAQDKIVVHNEDGTVTSIDIGESPLAAPAAQAPDKPAVKLRVRPEEAAPAPAAKPAQKSEKKPEAKKQTPQKKPPVKEQPAKKQTPAKKETPAKKAAEPKKKKPAAFKQKPAAPATSAPASAQKRPAAAPSSQRLGPDMTPDDAIRIALDVAPPARSVNAHPVNYKGLHAYQVVFETEDGKRSVFIDRETGKLVK